MAKLQAHLNNDYIGANYCYSDSERYAATAVWSVETHRIVFIIEASDFGLNYLSLSPSFEYALSVIDGCNDIQIRKTDHPGTVIGIINIEPGASSSSPLIEFSAFGRYLVTCHRQGDLRKWGMWDAATGKPVFQWDLTDADDFTLYDYYGNDLLGGYTANMLQQSRTGNYFCSLLHLQRTFRIRRCRFALPGMGPSL